MKVCLSGRLNRGRVHAAEWAAVLVLIAMIAGCSSEANPVNRIRARLALKKGNLSYLAGQYQDAVARYDAALRMVPRLAQASLNRAYSQEALFRASSDPQQRQQLATAAVASFDEYLGILARGAVGDASHAPAPSRIEEHILTLLVDSHQTDQAIARLRARYEKDPHDTSALGMLSRLDMERGNLDEAMDWQRKRVAAAPQDPDAQYSLGAFVWLLSYRDKEMDPAKRAPLLDEGMAALQKALELRPDDFETLIYINLLYIEKAKYAASDVQRAEFEAQAKTFRDRALALRKAPADTARQESGTH